MTTAGRPNKLHHAEYPARRLLERLGWTYAPRQALAAKGWDERDVLLRNASEAGVVAAQRVADRAAG